jgi:hypothetical protein
MAAVSVQATFTQSEKAAVVAYWSTPDRYTIDAPETAAKKGPWQVRLTPEGSLWLWNYNKVRGIGKLSPSRDPAPQNAQQQTWEKWIEAKVAFDRWSAERTAAEANWQVLGGEKAKIAAAPADPGPAPQEMIDLAGDPPRFAAAVAPLRYTIRFEPGVQYVYTDQVPMRPRFAYFRFAQGVQHFGVPVKQVPADELDRLLSEAGISSSEGRVMRSVSMLEGGFESVNTYDTGYLSVGLIQFATLSGGAGSLGGVLQRMKASTPDAFETEFRRYGVDVTDTGALNVVDPATGAELVGAEAVMKIIDDKRLTAVFQRAGALSRAFRVAQLQVAKDRYLPSNDTITLTVDGQTISGKVSDFIVSEAGMATLMDRKVNTGTTDPLTATVQRFANERKIQSLADLIPFEREIVTLLKYRKDYLLDTSLTQPTETVTRVFNSTSRSGTRRGRRH